MTINNEILLDRKKSNMEKTLPTNDENGSHVSNNGSGKQVELVPTVSEGTRGCFLIPGQNGGIQ